MKTVAVDFDGVLHAYGRKWHDGTIYDGPVPGAADAMAALLAEGYEVVVYSTRCYDRTVGDVFEPCQVAEMKQWLDDHGIPHTRVHTDPGKPLCMLFIDDNAYRFSGDWQKELPQVLAILQSGQGLGATGAFPQGHLHGHDEGQLQYAVGSDKAIGKVLLQFGKPVAWVGFGPKEAMQMSDALRWHATKMLPKR